MIGTLLLALLAQAPTATPTGDGGFPGSAVGHTPRVEIAWNRFYDYEQIHGLLDRLMEAYPDLVSVEVIGHSVENREMRVYTLNDPSTGEASSKPAMWVDGNVHGNEVQGGEAVVYTAWYLLENYGHNERVTDLLSSSAFYLLPMVNPDGRDSWFHDAHNAHSSRSGRMPLDSDRDGLFDEDGPDDLDDPWAMVGDDEAMFVGRVIDGLGQPVPEMDVGLYDDEGDFWDMDLEPAFGITAGVVSVPPAYYLAAPGGPSPHVEAELRLPHGSLAFTINHPDTLVAFPYAQNALHVSGKLRL